jgi:hypothetical protein
MKSFILKFIFTLLFISSVSLSAASIETTNRILTNVGERTITVLDVKREMDRDLYVTDKSQFEHPEIVFEFYVKNWRQFLQKMINDEVLVLEADKNKYNVKIHDINKKMEELYGSSSVETVRFLSMTPEQAYEASRKDLIGSHLSWYNVWSKAFLETTPSAIRSAYDAHIAKLPGKDEWTYQAMYFKGKDEKKIEDASTSINSLLEGGSFLNLTALLDEAGFETEAVKVGVSKDITLTTAQLSPNLLKILEKLEAGKMSDVVTAKGKGGYSGKVLHLKGFKKEPIPEFATMTDQIRATIMNGLGAKYAHNYFEKLYKKYDIQGLYGTLLQNSQLTPFKLEDERI